jgi:lysophospholipase L1-like esterase
MRFAAILVLLTGIAAAQAPRVPHIYVIGDSTANNAAQRGWGDHLGGYFEETKAVVVNRARAGRSSRTFRTEGLWDKVRDDLQAGDFVLIQFGHNDGGPPDKDRARGSLPGLGDESKEFTLPDGKQETVYTFGWYMRHFIDEARRKGATPIVLSPTVRNIWKGIAVERGPGQYMRWSAEVAGQTGAPFLDVTDAIADAYEDLGAERVKSFFPEDHTHTSPEGAELTASLIAATVRGVPESPLASLLSAKGLAVYPWPAPFDPARYGVTGPRDPQLPSVFLIGDSTVRNGHGDGANNQWGWGDPLVDRFDTARINVVNRAVGGLSSRTYLTQGHWARVLAMLKPGDFVIMQFGHNDNGPLDDKDRARGTLPGAGDETKEVDNPITKRHEVVHTYGWYLRRLVEDARAKGATPIVCSLIPRKTWKDGKIVRNSTSYQKWAAEVAAVEQAPYVDLNEMIAAKYDALGPAKVEPLFGDEHTHTSRAGAELNADSVVEGLKQIRDLPLVGYLK